ncbi:MAG: hypothetical protein JW959_13500 [Pirellulales bacterium]|nr:hypothetical protein [Pirellulales bacterium]
MIYDLVPTGEPLRQGDIFVGIPRVETTLDRILVVKDDEVIECSWQDIVSDGQAIEAVLPIRPVNAIIATQDCDAVRSDDITLCEIDSFRDVERKAKDTKNPKKWNRIITQQARINQKWFYLPADEIIGFKDKMAVDFRMTLRVPRLDLEASRHFRKGRLNNTAYEHFRERIGEFFRRYAYDEWYPLDSSEFEAYKSEYPDTQPFPWQQTTDGAAVKGL